LEKAKAAADLITNVTGSKDVTIKHLDLASLKSVRSFAEDINKNENKLEHLKI
jgi:ascorbate-specific PTS system EIIC-type component UlaA